MPSKAGRPAEWRRVAHALPIDEIASIMSCAWRADTAWIDDWDPRNPPRGQCGSSTLVMQDLHGGALMRGLVEDSPNRLVVHYWNYLPAGEVDVTWTQFGASARLVRAEHVDRADLLASGWLIERYELLRDRVARKRLDERRQLTALPGGGAHT
jgi:hypothetical protein